MKLHWFPFYWDDYSTKTLHLTQGQHGAYMLLLRWCYTTGNPVPAKQRYSIAQARLKHERSNTDTVLAEFFHEENGVWRNLKSEAVMSEAAATHEKNVVKGRAGGLKKASRAKAGLENGSSNYNYKDKNKEEDSNKIVGAASPPPPKPAKKSTTSIPENIPTATELDAARAYWFEMGRDDLDAAREARGFNAHHKGHGNRMADWGQAWVTWYTNAPKFNRKPNGASNGRTRKQSPHELAFDVARDYCAEILTAGSGSEGGGTDKAAVPLLPARPNGGSNPGRN